jgi:hypothetical protein
MIRILIASSFMFAGSITGLATSQANAQSPDPALLAPPAAQAVAPPVGYRNRLLDMPFRRRDPAATRCGLALGRPPAG